MKNIPFINMQKKPLEDLKLSWEGCEIPAMSEQFATKRPRAKYSALPMEGLVVTRNATHLEEWIRNAKLFEMEIESLLKLDFHRFWTTVYFDNEALCAITSFLQEATPCYLPILSITDDPIVIGFHERLMQKVLAIICRLITNKESDTEWMSKDYLAKLIYTKYLISIPMLFDLLTIYGRTNGEILGKIIQTVMEIEPKYLIDLEKSMKFIVKTFTSVQEQLGQGNTRENVQLLNDLCLHILDCAMTNSILLDVYPESRDICVAIKMEEAITNVYDNFIPSLYRGIYTYNEKSPYLNLINRARVELLFGFRCIVNAFIEKILDRKQYTKKSSGNLDLVEALLSIYTLCLSDNVFVTDYQKHYPIEIDIEILRQACPKMDTFKADFILQAFLCADENNFAKIPKAPVQPNHINGFDNFEEEGACALPIESTNDVSATIAIEEQIRLVQDILPDLGDGFVRKLLTRYESPESAISAVLECNLPPDLDVCDKAEIYIPPDRQEQLYVETGVRRINVFDGDDYDVRVSEVPKGIIKTGKGFPGQPKTVAALLDDKSHVRELKSRYAQYSNVEENVGYDDEYDDSYDAMTESESKKTPRKSQSMRDILVDEIEEEDDDEDDEEIPKKNPLNFCENPEDIRARYAEKRQQKFGVPKKNVDVVGKVKGQGQSDAVLANRQKKEVHKSSRANHNRKQGSSWKRNRGMIPS